MYSNLLTMYMRVQGHPRLLQSKWHSLMKPIIKTGQTMTKRKPLQRSQPSEGHLEAEAQGAEVCSGAEVREEANPTPTPTNPKGAKSVSGTVNPTLDGRVQGTQIYLHSTPVKNIGTGAKMPTNVMNQQPVLGRNLFHQNETLTSLTHK